MSLEITGKIYKMMPEQSGTSARGEWKKREFVIETLESYPKKVCISCWNEKVDDLNKFNIGQEVKVSLNLESREYNEKWYTDARAWRIETSSGNTGASSPVPSPEETFSETPENNFNEGIEDDLPF